MREYIRTWKIRLPENPDKYSEVKISLQFWGGECEIFVNGRICHRGFAHIKTFGTYNIFIQVGGHPGEVLIIQRVGRLYPEFRLCIDGHDVETGEPSYDLVTGHRDAVMCRALTVVVLVLCAFLFFIPLLFYLCFAPNGEVEIVVDRLPEIRIPAEKAPILPSSRRSETV